MGHVLMLDVPAEVYESLRQAAERAKQPPEIVAVTWLTTVTHQFADDPMEDFIGAWRSDGTAWPDQHDAYLGVSILEHSTNIKSGELNDQDFR